MKSLLAILLLASWFFMWGQLYGQARREQIVQTAWAECRERNDILHAALDAHSRSKWVSWDFIYDQAKKAERRQAAK